MTSNKDNTDSLLSSIPQLSKDNWFTFKDRSIALLESKDLFPKMDLYIKGIIRGFAGENRAAVAF
jgi:hypothetical protein